MGAKTCDAGAGVRRHPGGVNVLNTSGTVTAFFRGEHPLDQDLFNFYPTQDKAGFGQTGPGTGGYSGPRPGPRPTCAREYGSAVDQLLNAASKDALGGSKSNALSRVRASGAPCSRSMPASSHSTETGPW